jgi:hypothetical protein
VNGERNHGLAIGLLISGLICVACRTVALGNFASAPSGDLAVCYVLLTAGAVLLLGLEFACARRRRPRRAGRPTPVREAARTWLP